MWLLTFEGLFSIWKVTFVRMDEANKLSVVISKFLHIICVTGTKNPDERIYQ